MHPRGALSHKGMKVQVCSTQACSTPSLHYIIICYLAKAFIHNDLQVIRLSRDQSPHLEQCGVPQGPNGGTNLIAATAGQLQLPTFQAPVKRISH